MTSPPDMPALHEAAREAFRAAQDRGATREEALAAYSAVIRGVPTIGLAAAPAAAPLDGMRTRLLSRSGLRSLPTPEPLIADTLDLRTLAVLVGPWGSGKSFLALDWACCVATGKAWQGREVRPGHVLYVAAEGAYGLDSRVSAWEYAWHQEVSDEALTVYPDPVNLADAAAVAQLVELVEAERYALVVVDTLARCTVGADENSARDMGLVVDALDRIKRAAGDAVVLAVHHTGKDRQTVRGSSAVEGGVDTVYKVESDGGLTFRLYRDKRKDGPRDDELSLRLRPVPLAGGSSCAVEVATPDPDALGDAEAAVLAAMREAFPEGASSPQLRDYVMSEARLSKATAYRAIAALQEAGVLVNTSTPQRPFLRLAGAG